MVTTKQNDVIFNYITIESGCSDNPDVHIKEVQISEGPLYTVTYTKADIENSNLASTFFKAKFATLQYYLEY